MAVITPQNARRGADMCDFDFLSSALASVSAKRHQRAPPPTISGNSTPRMTSGAMLTGFRKKFRTWRARATTAGINAGFFVDAQIHSPALLCSLLDGQASLAPEGTLPSLPTHPLSLEPAKPNLTTKTHSTVQKTLRLTCRWCFNPILPPF